jgi:tetratricopeptide (TPR) repeat protein
VQLLCAGQACAQAFAIHQGGVRVDASLGNAIYLAEYMMFAVAIAVWQAFSQKGWARYALLALAAIETFVLFATATRGVILGFVAAAVFAALLWAIESGKQQRRYAAGAFVGLLILIGGFVAFRHSSFIQNDPTLGRLASISLSDGETSTRFALWNIAIEGFKDRPITGWGQDGFNYVFNTYYNPSLYNQEAWFDRVHNTYLDWLIAGGAPALLLFLALLVVASLALYRSTLSRPERLLLLAALVAYAIQAVVEFDNLFTYVPIAAILAVIHGASSRPIKRLEAEKVPNEVLQSVGPLMLVVTVLVVWFVNVPAMAAAKDTIYGVSATTSIANGMDHFKKAIAANSFASQEVREQLITYASQMVQNSQIPEKDRQSLMNFALTEMGKEIAATPKDARLRMEYALGFRAIGDHEHAMEQIKIAEQLSPRKQQILLQEGLENWQANDFVGAKAAFQKAYDLDPSFTDLAAYVAVGDIINGDLAIGKALIMKTFGTTIVDKDIFVYAYYQAKDFDDLIAVLQLRVKNSGGDVESRFRLAQAYGVAGRMAEARKEIIDTVAEHPDASAAGSQLLISLHQPGL